MKNRIMTTAAATALLALAIYPAFSASHGERVGTWRNEDRGHAAPGPIAGAGIVYLMAAGGYGAYRFWRNKMRG